MTDDQICKVIRRLLANDELPDGIVSIDLLQTVRLLVQHADEQDLYLSQGTLARHLGCAHDTIAKSQQRLHDAGWIVRRKGGHKGATNHIALQVDELSLGNLIKTVISEEARGVAKRYAVTVMKRKHVKSLPRGREAQYAASIQQMANRCEGDFELVGKIIQFAFNSSFQKAAICGAGTLVNMWARLKTAYDAQSALAPAAVPAPTAPTAVPATRLLPAPVELKPQVAPVPAPTTPVVPAESRASVLPAQPATQVIPAEVRPFAVRSFPDQILRASPDECAKRRQEERAEREFGREVQAALRACGG